ncbi:SLD3 domain-containing protein [Histoplasma capsulatum]|uniref:SLD3 domain-containing protein n=1 Tax=Ajellomyces capsulatus TaxID=5037 RepID=A0A8A1M895_AJECA|nr:SLD3 domain-containing protein [Histoplasma capsulatum]
MASSHSRPAATAVLEPASPTLLNSLKTKEKERKEEAQTAQLLKRRKISHDGCSVISKTETTRAAFVSSAVTIRHHHHTPQSLPLPLPQDNIKLIPVALLPRSQLPLSWLDPCPASAKRIQSGRLFVANISALELDLHHQQQQRRCGPVVLAVRLAVEDEEVLVKGEEELYVVERVKKGVYAISALGSWVLEGDLMVAAAKGAGEEVVGDVNVYSGGRGEKEGDWLEKATISDPAAGFFAYSRPRKAIMEKVALAFGPKLCGKRGPHSLSLETSGLSSVSGFSIAHDEQVDRRDTARSEAGAPHISLLQMTNEDIQPDTQSEEAIGVGPCEPAEAKVTQTPQELFDNLRSQYLEALYISKTSVAYFAKGPLSRARASFQSSNENLSMKPTHLSNFYRECILPVKKMDLKYKDSLPEAIQNFLIEMSDDEIPANTMKQRTRKAKKAKLGKNGLYPEESDFVRRWWRNRDLSETSVPQHTSRQEEIRRLTTDLRLRETQLQIVLILETISLEASYSSTTTQVLPATTEAQTSQPQRRTKERKQQDLNTLLELLVDRLCIWHAVSFNDTILTTSAGGKSGSACKTAGNDKLRDFCTEVIIPFYAGRLPDQCKTISRKLGGLIAISPTRPAISRSKSGSSAQPGASVKRSHNQKSQQRTLQRVLTDEKMASKSRAPSLSRSNTTPSLDGLKRENSEPPLLSSISGARGGIQKPKRVDNREIDLDAVAKQHEVKLKRMNSLLEQKKELDAAIDALRKPNRELVAKDFADTVEKRASMCNTRKSKHPVRNPLGQGVQVMATPRGSRRKDFGTVTVGSSTRMSRALTLSNEKLVPSAALSDDIQLIPSSSTRPSHPPKRQSFSSKHARHSSIHETPTRSSTRLSSGPSNSGISADNDFDSTPLPRQTGNLFKVFKVPKLPETSRAFMQQQEMSPSTLRKTRSHPNFAHCGNTNDGTNSNNNTNNHLPFIHINNVTSSIQETPPRPACPSYLQPPETIISPSLSRHNEIQEKRNQGAIIFTTPIKNTVAAVAGFTPGDDHSTHPMANTGIVTADATPEKSIYDQLGWNDDDVYDDDDELALP